MHERDPDDLVLDIQLVGAADANVYASGCPPAKDETEIQSPLPTTRSRVEQERGGEPLLEAAGGRIDDSAVERPGRSQWNTTFT